jgi:hypothetical protein
MRQFNLNKLINFFLLFLICFFSNSCKKDLKPNDESDLIANDVIFFRNTKPNDKELQKIISDFEKNLTHENNIKLFLEINGIPSWDDGKKFVTNENDFIYLIPVNKKNEINYFVTYSENGILLYEIFLEKNLISAKSKIGLTKKTVENIFQYFKVKNESLINNLQFRKHSNNSNLVARETTNSLDEDGCYDNWWETLIDGVWVQTSNIWQDGYCPVGGGAGPLVGTWGNTNNTPVMPPWWYSDPNNPAGGGTWNPLLMNSHGFLYARIVQLDSLLNVNKFAIEPCAELLKLLPYNRMWQEVSSFTPIPYIYNRMDSVLGVINSNNFLFNQQIAQQSLDDAYGTVVNCDFFPVKITSLPTGMTSDSLLEYFRKNLDTFCNPVCSFSPYFLYSSNPNNTFFTFSDSIKFNSVRQNSLGSLIYIDISGDDGVVVLSDYHNSNISGYSFTFTTLKAPGAFNHPVAGHRKFGIYPDPLHGGYNFYTMGVDRAFDMVSAIVEPLVLNGGENLWKTMQNKMVSFINSNGGVASKFNFGSNIPYISARPNYTAVRMFLQNQITYAELLIIMGC